MDVLLARENAPKIADLLAAERTLHAPHLIETEVLSALRRWVARGELDPPRALVAVEDLAALRLVHHSHAPFSARVWDLRERMTAYDGTYVALAETLDAALVTSDRGLARGAADLVDVRDVA